ncbi:MAG TPA: sigma 54-interacting transcriptional regulator [Pyrinomonadaceae bacterium]|jgi:formate hydrogenlyase transcriptional activator|nr:sigma 54-interacting transcriptional regulator [Pyrinomonadaceae bacterium]
MPEETPAHETQTASPAGGARRSAGEAERAQILLEVTAAVVSNLSIGDLLRAVSDCLRRFFNHDVASLVLYDEEAGRLRVLGLDTPEPGDLLREGSLLPLEGTPPGLAILTRRTVMRERVDLEEFTAPEIRLAYEAGLRSGCSVPLISRDRVLGAINVASLRESAFTPEDAELLRHIADPVAIAVENVLNFERATKEGSRVRTLLEVNNAVATHLDIRELLRATSGCLHAYFQHDFAALSLYDEATRSLRVHAFDRARPDTDIYEGEPVPIEGTLSGLAFATRRPVFRSPVGADETSAPMARRFFEQQGLQSFCCVPLVTGGRALGIIALGSRQRDAMTPADVEMFQRIADQIAIAVENSLNFERATKERERAETLLEVSNAITTILDLRELLRATSDCLRRYFKHDLAGMALYDPESGQLRVHSQEWVEPSAVYLEEGVLMPLEGTPAGLAFRSRRPVLIQRLEEWTPSSPILKRALAAGIRSSCNAPLISHDRALGCVAIASRREAAFKEADAEMLGHIARQFAIAVENALQYREIEGLKNKLASEKLYLEEEIKAEYNFAEIVGQSRALKDVLEQIRTVAPTDSVVLICGETGTGKELIARAVHDLSARRERTMVKVNCAAIPTGLLESEFFGHERGAFTGAVAQRAGRFELANKGTLFLDEVGEIPVELQPKLLRVLQEQEFERLGGSRTIKVDVRLIAATNCNLRQMVAEKKFRSDLFYRLNVFPILLPPLRERAEDIPLLAGYFAQKHSRRMNKRIDSIPSETVEALCRYGWPGNVRELENFVERAVILTRGHELQAPLAELEVPAAGAAGASVSAAAPAGLVSLADAERAHIEDVLRHTKGVVGGRGGAAEILGLPISTLRDRMKKLGLM